MAIFSSVTLASRKDIAIFIPGRQQTLAIRLADRRIFVKISWRWRDFASAQNSKFDVQCACVSELVSVTTAWIKSAPADMYPLVKYSLNRNKNVPRILLHCHVQLQNLKFMKALRHWLLWHPKNIIVICGNCELQQFSIITKYTQILSLWNNRIKLRINRYYKKNIVSLKIFSCRAL